MSIRERVSPIVTAIEEEAVAERAEGNTVFIVTTFEASQGLVIAFGIVDMECTQGMQILVNVGKDDFMPFSGVSEHFADGESGETDE